MSRLLSLEFWIRAFCALALCGLLLLIAGYLHHSPRLLRIGLWLEAPLFALAALLVLFAAPYLLWKNHQLRRQRR